MRFSFYAALSFEHISKLLFHLIQGKTFSVGGDLLNVLLLHCYYIQSLRSVRSNERCVIAFHNNKFSIFFFLFLGLRIKRALYTCCTSSKYGRCQQCLFRAAQTSEAKHYTKHLGQSAFRHFLLRFPLSRRFSIQEGFLR